MSDQKPNPFYQIIKGLGYFLIFLGANTFITAVFVTIYTMEKLTADHEAGIVSTTEALSEYSTQQIYAHSNLILPLYGGLFLMIVILQFLIRKKKVLEELWIKKFSPGYLPALLLMAVGLALFANTVLAFLPYSLLEGYLEKSSFITMGTLAGSLISQGIFAPIVEEVAFRGLMLSRFNKALPRWIGVLISSFFFGLVHGNIIWFIFTFVIGVLLCLVANKTDSILSTILVHALFNVIGTLFGYLLIPALVVVYIALAVTGFVLIVISCLMLFRKRKAQEGAAQA